MVPGLIGRISDRLNTAVWKVDVVGSLSLVAISLLLVAEVGTVIRVLDCVRVVVLWGSLLAKRI